MVLHGIRTDHKAQVHATQRFRDSENGVACILKDHNSQKERHLVPSCSLGSETN